MIKVTKAWMTTEYLGALDSRCLIFSTINHYATKKAVEEQAKDFIKFVKKHGYTTINKTKGLLDSGFSIICTNKEGKQVKFTAYHVTLSTQCKSIDRAKHLRKDKLW